MEAVADQLAVITGASSGIGLEVARLCARRGWDLVIAADEEHIEDAARELSATGISCTAVRCDLCTAEGVAHLASAIEASGRRVELLIATDRSSGRELLGEDLKEVLKVVNTDIEGMMRLVHGVANQMRSQGSGRILIIGSIAGFIPGALQAVYDGYRVFLDSFAIALSKELKHTGISVKYLANVNEGDSPGRASAADGNGAKSADALFDAMINGELELTADLAKEVRAMMSSEQRLAKLGLSKADATG